MATAFPTALDVLTNPTATDPLDSAAVPHASQHANLNDAMEAVQARLGVFPKAAAGNVLLNGRVTGDDFDRWRVLADGKMEWGPGNAATDVLLDRSSAGILRMHGRTLMAEEQFPASVPLIACGAASQTANLQEWQNSAGMVLAKVYANGKALFSTGLASSYGTAHLQVVSDNSASDPVVAIESSSVSGAPSVAFVRDGSLRFAIGENRDVAGTLSFHDYAAGASAARLSGTIADTETSLLLRRNVGGVYSLQRVSMGAADSGGAGFKALRVPN